MKKGFLGDSNWGALLAALFIAGCTRPDSAPQSPPPPIIASTSPEIGPPAAIFPVSPISGPKIQAVQRALQLLGYQAGEADGMIGPLTRRAISAFQKDHGVAADGILSDILAEAILAASRSETKFAHVKLRKGDLLAFSDGVVEVAPAESAMEWASGEAHSLIAIRPSTANWPLAARAGLDWAIDHALDSSPSSGPVDWSSTALKQRFHIYAFNLDAREQSIVAGFSSICRRFELRSIDSQGRYPSIVCKNAGGEWYVPHTTIRLRRPAKSLGPAK